MEHLQLYVIDHMNQLLSRHLSFQFLVFCNSFAKVRGFSLRFFQIFVLVFLFVEYLAKLRYRSSAEVSNLGYMYPWRYICLSEGVHLRLEIEQKYIFLSSRK